MFGAGGPLNANREPVNPAPNPVQRWPHGLVDRLLADDPAAPRFVATVRGAGYRAAGPVERLDGVA